MTAGMLSGGLRDGRTIPAGFTVVVATLFCSQTAFSGVRSIDVQPGQAIPMVDVTTNGKAYTALGSQFVDIWLTVSAACDKDEHIEHYYLISNSSRPDFKDERVNGDVTADEQGFKLKYDPEDKPAAIHKHRAILRIPVEDLFKAKEPVPLKICNELLEHRVAKGMRATQVLSRQWKIMQPLSVSFLAGCSNSSRIKITRWSKLSTTQMINYVCRASDIAVAAEAKLARAAQAEAAAQTASKPAPPARQEPPKQPVKVAAVTTSRRTDVANSRPQPAPKKEPVRTAEPQVKKEEPAPPPPTAETREIPVAPVQVASAKPVSTAAEIVSNVSVVAEPAVYDGDCPALVAFKGTIMASRDAMVKFHFDDNGNPAATRVMKFKKDRAQHFRTQALFDESKSGSMRLVIEEPDARFVEARYQVKCR